MFIKVNYKRLIPGNAVINTQFVDKEVFMKVPLKARSFRVEDRTDGTYKIQNIFSLIVQFGKDDEMEFNFTSYQDREKAMIDLRLKNDPEKANKASMPRR